LQESCQSKKDKRAETDNELRGKMFFNILYSNKNYEAYPRCRRGRAGNSLSVETGSGEGGSRETKPVVQTCNVKKRKEGVVFFCH